MYDNNSITSPSQPNFFTPSEDMVELLQSILEGKSNATVSFEEAQEVGIQLVSLYECLARDRQPQPEEDNGHDQ